MRKNLLLTLFCFAIAIGQVLAQERSVSGKVTSAEDGTALPGVNVIIKGTTNGTATDAEGRYSISVPGNVTLQ
ncbi:MAG TPA: carboxypeptidase-like regulatory domain-containing protein, partial [Cyclobacteriaceae bacterium]|nr:carboxypeptidase-like regulatory domain-containing protein [Cyclobacteriaceae bacterium]